MHPSAWQRRAIGRTIDALQQQDRVRKIPNSEEHFRAIAKSYVESPGNTLKATYVVDLVEARRRSFGSGHVLTMR
jgi:hypothetical protein